MHTETEGAVAAATTAADAQLLDDVIAGLSRSPKRLPSKYFYDERGSELFDRICELPEYYPTRTELTIMRRHGPEMAACIGPGAQVVELGAGSTRKIRLLLDQLEEPSGYVPVDISESYLLQQSEELQQDYPELTVEPVAADFMEAIALPALPSGARRRVIYFPGSTIGNLGSGESRDLLQRIADAAAPEGGLLIGLDLRKDPTVLEAAYNDAQGVTRAFNLNMLHRLCDELHAEIAIEQFEHRAFYNEKKSRVEMHLVSLRDQSIQVGPHEFPLARGESIHTENSYKFDLAEFGARARAVGLEPRKAWTDERSWFGVQYLACDACE